MIIYKSCISSELSSNFLSSKDSGFVEKLSEIYAQDDVEFPKFVSSKENGNISEASHNFECLKISEVQKPQPLQQSKDEFGLFPNSSPPNSYESPVDYQRLLCSKLHQEESLETEVITSRNIESCDNERVVINFANDASLKKLVPENLRYLEKSPFSVNQALYVSSPNIPHVFACIIVKVYTDYKNGIVQVSAKFCNWHHAVTTASLIGASVLTIMRCSIPTSRVLKSLERIEKTPFTDMLLGQKRIRKFYSREPLEFPLTNELNNSQINVIKHALNNKITFQRFPILVVAASNIAIDNLAEKFVNSSDLKALRIISKSKEKDYDKSHILSSICLHTQVLSKIGQANQQTYDAIKEEIHVPKENYKLLMGSWFNTATTIVQDSQVIFTTISGAGNNLFKDIKIPMVIMDESTQSSEAATLVPLTLKGVSKFVFVGDEKQLSALSKVPFLTQSLFERILKNGTYGDPHVLNVQYRMHPKISEFPVQKFYKGKLNDGVLEVDRFMDEKLDAISFLDYGFSEMETKVSNPDKNGFSFENSQEASIVLDTVTHLYNIRQVSHNDIGIITPYSAQRDLIAQFLFEDINVNPENLPIEDTVAANEIDDDDVVHEDVVEKHSSRVKLVNDLMVSSIDAFQGREKKIIIFSCVRSNSKGNFGFLKDPRRLNVALTRASHTLIIIGNKSCLSKGDELWADLIDYFEKNDRLISFEEFMGC
ncbi:hypothetical protein WICANDRAFT_65637 [Wickerhamomyces anomalus NRRL Y-366-8]|uniref:DNA2/NAM7 helicase-like C-terminal domain-containing protein n=1 Tax=Wickerhamomyces anomalus (strain ATCC 58044 / CBS 1984 / NCYC 433 / NRRL Y-366-8) TaxID=683960 RepID=A0A1E3NUK0_WICAA|nr:uncharacterized protein WICANDRAFT_65637 [Wickerhamomyces anomalus NRRL Y-366-8]ODQ56754.1 hypothetical protein WICANDRAFT_65637 [Wickerhamomyces anomalus NRRL Y-366-8]